MRVGSLSWASRESQATRPAAYSWHHWLTSEDFPQPAEATTSTTRLQACSRRAVRRRRRTSEGAGHGIASLVASSGGGTAAKRWSSAPVKPSGAPRASSETAIASHSDPTRAYVSQKLSD